MKIDFSLLILSILFMVGGFSCNAQKVQTEMANEQIEMTKDQTYTLIIEGFDWGPAATKVILPLADKVSEVDKSSYGVTVNRATDCAEISSADANGDLTVIHAYVSDGAGRAVPEGNHATLVFAAGPMMSIGSPIKYFRNEKCRGNQWIDFNLTITSSNSQQVWNREAGRKIPIVDEFDSSKSFSHDGITMSYAAFKPSMANAKSPLIIWLHGGGEGGTDPRIPLLANKASNYASEKIQGIFEGAYVLVPQCPGAWMHNAQGITTRGKENDIYNVGLMALITDYVNSNPGVDKSRIYVGGCSNGGYMGLKLILEHPDYFAAGFLSALAYSSEFITDAQIESIKHVPIWFIHSKDDSTTKADITVLPVYKRLKAAGAKDVHLSFYDFVVDLTGFFGGEDFHYNGHWSWIYSHANECTKDYDGSSVKVNGKPVTIMEWMATMSTE